VATEIETLQGGLELEDKGASAVATKILTVLDNLDKKLVDVSESSKHTSESTGMLAGAMEHLSGGFIANVASGKILADVIEGVFEKVKQLIEEVPKFVLEGAKVANVEAAFDHLTESAGRSADTLLGELKTGVRGTVTDFQLLQLANRDLAAGLRLSDDQFGVLAKGAFALSKSLGIDVTDAFDRMNDAMLTGRTRSIALLTGKIDLRAAEERYAEAAGKTVDQLSETGKLQAAQQAILERVGAATDRLGEQTVGLGEKYQQARTFISDFLEDLGKTIATSKVLNAGLDEIKNILVEAFGTDKEALVKAIAKAVDGVLVETIEFAKTTAEVIGAARVGWIAFEGVLGDAAQMIDAVGEGLELVRIAADKLAQAKGLAGFKEDAEKAWIELGDLNKRMEERAAWLGTIKQQEDDASKSTDFWTGALERVKARMEEANKTTDDAQEKGLHLKDLHHDLAGSVDTASDSFKESAASVKKWNEAVEEISQVGVGFQGTLETISGAVVEAIKYYLDAGVAQDKLATYYGLTATQVKSVASELKAEQESWKIEQKSIEETTRLWDEYFALRVAHGGTTTETQLAQIDRWFNDEVAKLKDFDDNWQGHYDALVALADEKTQSILVDWKAIGENSTRVLQEQADKAKATYDYMLANSGDFTAGTIDYFRRMADAAQAAVDATAIEAARAIAIVGGSTQEAAAAQKAATDAMVSGLLVVGDTAEKATDKGTQGFSRLSSAISKTADDLKLLVPPDFSWMDAYKKAGLFVSDTSLSGLPVNTKPSASFGAGGSVTMPGLKSFETGGRVEAGQVVPALLHGPENVIPDKVLTSLTARSGGSGDTYIFNVTAPTNEMAKQVINQITNIMKNQRKWPAN
jgi:hypothetical protein